MILTAIWNIFSQENEQIHSNILESKKQSVLSMNIQIQALNEKLDEVTSTLLLKNKELEDLQWDFASTDATLSTSLASYNRVSEENWDLKDRLEAIR